MPADPPEAQIVAEIRRRLAAIDGGADWWTDAGLRLHLGRLLDEYADTLPALVVVVDEAPVRDLASPTRPYSAMRVTVQGVVRADTDDVLSRTIQIASDIKRALHTGPLRLAGATTDFEFLGVEHLPAEPGESIAAASVTLTVPYTDDFEG